MSDIIRIIYFYLFIYKVTFIDFQYKYIEFYNIVHASMG